MKKIFEQLESQHDESINNMEEQLNQMKKKKKSKIIIGIIILILIATLPFVIPKINEQQSKIDNEIAELQDKQTDLKAQKSQEFKINGFTKKYYEIEQELSNINQQIQDKEMKQESFFVIFILGGAVLFFIIIVSTFIRFTSFSFSRVLSFGGKNGESHFSLFNSFSNTHKTILNHQERIFNIIDKSLEQEELKNTKLKALKCPSCKANVSHDATKCEYCGTNLIKVKK